MGFYRCGGGGEKLLPSYTIAVNDSGYKVANKDGNCLNLFMANSQVNQCILGNNITNMVRMFDRASNLNSILFNGILPGVDSLAYTFRSTNINQPIVINNNTTICDYMFDNCTKMGSPVIIGNNVTSAYAMFRDINQISSLSIPKSLSNAGHFLENSKIHWWEDYSRAIAPIFFIYNNNYCLNESSYMFYNCRNLRDFSYGYYIINTFTVNKYEFLYQDIRDTTQLPLTQYTDIVFKNCNNMFAFCNNLNNIQYSTIFKGPDLGSLFRNCYNLRGFKRDNGLMSSTFRITIDGATTYDRIFNCPYMFEGTDNLGNLSTAATQNWQIVQIKCLEPFVQESSVNISCMFGNAYRMFSNSGLIGVNFFGTQNFIGHDDVTYNKNFEGAFSGCRNFNAPLDVKFYSNTSLIRMFNGCKNLNSKITITAMGNNQYNCYGMFGNCNNLAVAMDIPSSAYNCQYMFTNCNNLTRINIHGNASTDWANRNFYGFVWLRANTKRLNIWCNNQSAIIDHFPVNGTSLTWTTSGNAKYNAAANIYVYKNYSAV